MRKQILLLIPAIMSVVGTAFAADNRVTSVDYVDAGLATKQGTIPAANTAGVGAGESVITYTASNGQIGERALFTGGTYSADDADKLITASALNTAFTNLPETPTTKLVCANSPDCTLWTIVDQTAYGMTPFNPDVSIDGTSYCYRSLSGTANDDGACNADTLSYLGATGNKSGKWGVVFPYGDVSGISVCSATTASSMGTIATDAQAATMDAEYAAQAGGGLAASATGQQYCWCKMEKPTVSGSPWVSGLAYGAGFYCAYMCAEWCGSSVQSDADIRGAVFGMN